MRREIESFLEILDDDDIDEARVETGLLARTASAPGR
jgi:hypothetical protein